MRAIAYPCGDPMEDERGVRAQWAMFLWLAIAGSGCRPASAPPPAPAEAVPAPAPGRVQISGDDALAQLLSWRLPEVVLAPGELARARAQARRALAAGDLFEHPDSALPLLYALARADPGHAGDARLLQAARGALFRQADAALAAADADLNALRSAQQRAVVARRLWPTAPDTRALEARVLAAEQAWQWNARGEALLGAGDLGDPAAGEPGGALAAFRAALAVAPGSARAQAGLAAVEQALLARAEGAAAAGDFAAAAQALRQAARVRGAAGTAAVAAAQARVEAAREARLRALRDAGLIALADPRGLDVARGQLAQMLRIGDPAHPASLELRERIDLATHYGLFRPGQVFTDGMADGARGPELVVVPHGAFRMGSPQDDPAGSELERPQHAVRFERGFAMMRREVTVGQFRRFVQATGYVPRATQRGHSLVYDGRSGNFVRASGIDWRSGYDGRPAADDMPVLHVTARDAEAYAAWLSQQTGAHYRLPSEAEFEYALRAGSRSRWPWGDGPTPPAASENLAGARDVSPQGRRWGNAVPGYGDGWWGPAPVGSFAPNAFGLYDMAGNASEWVADCWHAGYRRAPATGAAWVNPGCRNRLYRGGSWASAPSQARSAWRAFGGVDATNARVGFRLVRVL